MSPFLFMSRETTYDKEFAHFLRGQEVTLERSTVGKMAGLTSQQIEAMTRLAMLPSFNDIQRRLQASDVSTRVKTMDQ